MDESDALVTRISKFTDGRLIKVVKAPMPDGGWVATHEDVTEQVHRDSIDSAIASFRERVEMIWTIAPRQKTCMDRWMQCLYTAIEELPKTGNLCHFGDRQPGVCEGSR